MSIDEQPLVTVVTVTYNSSRFVRDTIESVLSQEYRNIEYIISDDSSTDDTWEIIRSYSDPRIKAYRNEFNLREYPNRNKAIDLATGKYLIFIDGDDIIYPHGILFFVGMMESFPTAAVAIQKNYINNILFPALIHPEESLDNYFFGSANLLSSSLASNFFRTSLLQKIGLNTHYATSDDEVRLRIAAQADVLLTAGWVSWPRETPDQASARISREKAYLEQLEFASMTLKSFSSAGGSEETTKKFRTELIRKACREAMSQLRTGNVMKASSILRFLNISWPQAIKQCFVPPVRKDIFSHYSPSNPFRRGFLQGKILP